MFWRIVNSVLFIPLTPLQKVLKLFHTFRTDVLDFFFEVGFFKKDTSMRAFNFYELKSNYYEAINSTH
jgi:hypothetical protein